MSNWKCTACDWHGEEIEIRKEEYFKETRLEPAEWVWYCPVCHKTETLEEDAAAYCAWCEDEVVSDEGEICTECRTCYAEAIADEANGH